LEGVRWETPTASIVVIVTSTVYELLFRKISEGSVLNKIVRFDCCNSGEGPAAAATGLVFDWGYSIDVPPVPVSRVVLKILRRSFNSVLMTCS
jgi:hypothetical protein